MKKKQKDCFHLIVFKSRYIPGSFSDVVRLVGIEQQLHAKSCVSKSVQVCCFAYKSGYLLSCVDIVIAHVSIIHYQSIEQKRLGIMVSLLKFCLSSVFSILKK